MITKEIKIPAKAMLFGEYAVLQFSPACAVTLPHIYFQISLQLLPHANTDEAGTKVFVKSSFFKSGFHSFSIDKPSEDNFFSQLLQPWKTYLSKFNLNIEIHKSFRPSLGFGSSSAIIAGVSIMLHEIFVPETPPMSSEIYWKQVRSSLEFIQGSGSGYDVGVQTASYMKKTNKICLWSYQNVQDLAIPIINEIALPQEQFTQFGCFLQTHCYSDTKKHLAKHMADKEKDTFIQKQGQLSENFIHNSSVSNIKNLMQLSQSFFPCPPEINSITEKISGLPFKSMGAGYGDCLWVLCYKETLLAKGFSNQDIAFAFEDTIMGKNK